jgi:hypothetical protein
VRVANDDDDGNHTASGVEASGAYEDISVNFAVDRCIAAA